MYPEYCKDEQGVTSCACPEGRNGDGRKKGSGCKRHFPLDTALGNILNTQHSSSDNSFSLLFLFLIPLLLMQLIYKKYLHCRTADP
jgi:hypothetical protein